jgi:beta-fructofuranosidase
VLGPYDLAGARLVTDESLYVRRLLRRRDDSEWVMFAFHNLAADCSFVGSIRHPMPVRWEGHEFHVIPEAISVRGEPRQG